MVLVGGGPQRADLHAFRDSHPTLGVHCVDWCSYDELPAYYALASCLVLPSVSEPWGIVVNEAMACGLPILASQACGCVPELCRPGENGYVFDPYSIEEMAGLLVRMSEEDGRGKGMQQACHRIIDEFGLETWAESLIAGIKAQASMP